MSQRWAEKWSKYGVEGFVVLVSDQQGGPPGEAACQKFKEDFGLELTLLYDPAGLTAPYGTKEMTYVLNTEAQLVYEQFGSWMAGIETELEGVLGFEME